MRANRGTPEGWQGSVRRVATHVLVIGIHLGAWLLFFGDAVMPWSLPQTRTDQRGDSLSIHFIPMRALPPAHRPPPAPSTPPSMPRLRYAPGPAPATRAARSPAAPAPDVVTTTPTSLLPDYIPGGNRLHGSGRDYPPAVHLPGSDTPIVQGFHLTDPRMQGVAGVARALQTLFGVADPHCLDVEAWRGMTEPERLARHLSLAQVEHTAETYRCGPG